MNQLYDTFPCTHCLSACAITFDQLLRETDVEYAECDTEMDFITDIEATDAIETLGRAYDKIADVLTRRHVPIHFAC